MAGFVSRRIRRGKLLLVLFGVACWLAAIVPAGLFLHVTHVLGAAELLDDESLQRDKEFTWRKYHYVTVTHGPMQDAGWRDRLRGETLDRNVYLLRRVGPRWLVIRVAEDQRRSAEYTGVLVRLENQLRADIDSTTGLGNDLLPEMLDTTGLAEKTDRQGLATLTIGLLLVGAYLIGLPVWRTLDPSRDPSVRSLQTYGNPNRVAAKIESEIDHDALLQIGPTLLTSSWLISVGWLGLRVARLDDIVWIFLRRNPKGRLLAVAVYTKRSVKIEVPGKPRVLEEMFDAIFMRVPWARSEYDLDLERHVRRNGLEGLIDQAEERRRLWLEESGAE